MTMNWIETSRDLMLEQVKLMNPLLQRMQDPEFFNSFNEVLEPLEDGTVDPGDEKLVVERMLALLGEEFLVSLRRAADVYLELGKVYERLRNADEDELRAFARMSIEVHLMGSGLIETWAKLAREAQLAREQLDSLDSADDGLQVPPH